MAQRQLAGSRIRDRRLDRGMRQSALARAVGISASYLNLIEHNRRRIAGRLLNDIARVLDTDPDALSEGAGGTLLDELRAAAAALPEPGAELDRTEDFAGRFPGWAGLAAAQVARIAALEGRVAGLTDRLSHDPQLATSLHEVISAVTSIRATSSILVSGEDLDRDWQARFHRNIHEDSLRLAESSRALVSYLEGPGDQGAALSPPEAVAQFLDARGYHVAELEGEVADHAPDAVARAAPGLSGAARQLAATWLHRYRDDAVAMPLADFSAAARDCGHDPVPLAQRFGTGLAAVLRRIAALPPGAGHPRAGLAICDAAGALTLFKPVSGLSLPRVAAGCPLWPLYQALGQPGRPLRATVALPGVTAPRFLCYAVAGPRGLAGFDAPPVIEATMLVLPGAPAPAEPVQPVGIACRICPRPACPARREPSILPEMAGG